MNEEMALCVLVFCVAIISARAATPLVRYLAARLGAVDHPGSRKVHTRVMPRLGGVCIVCAIGVTILGVLMVACWPGNVLQSSGIFFSLDDWFPVLLGTAVVFASGVWDDWRDLPVWVKLCFQAVAAGVIVGWGMPGGQVAGIGSVFTMPLAFLWVVGITNAFNLIDGLDGLAVGLGIIAASTHTVLFLAGGNVSGAMLSITIVGALIGFLPYNFFPATIFLGDSGSLTVGFLLAATSIHGVGKEAFASTWYILLLVFWIPVLDTGLAILRRSLQGIARMRSSKAGMRRWLLPVRLIFKADQQHIHHRLLALGWSQRQAVMLLYTLACGLSCCALMIVLVSPSGASGSLLIVMSLATCVGVRKLGYRAVLFTGEEARPH